MNRRRQYIVDKKFQVKTALSVISFATIVSALILIAIAVSLVYNDNRIHNIIKSEDGIFQALTVISSKGINDPEYKTAIVEMSKDHIKNFNMVDRIIDYNRILLIALVILFILQGILLYMIMIRKTNRIAGPVYVMSNYFREMIDGKLPNPRAIRKKDEFSDFYDLFIKLVGTLKQREKKKK